MARSVKGVGEGHSGETVARGRRLIAENRCAVFSFTVAPVHPTAVKRSPPDTLLRFLQRIRCNRSLDTPEPRRAARPPHMNRPPVSRSRVTSKHFYGRIIRLDPMLLNPLGLGFLILHECVDEQDYNDGSQNDHPIGD